MTNQRRWTKIAIMLMITRNTGHPIADVGVVAEAEVTDARMSLALDAPETPQTSPFMDAR